MLSAESAFKANYEFQWVSCCAPMVHEIEALICGGLKQRKMSLLTISLTFYKNGYLTVFEKALYLATGPMLIIRNTLINDVG